MKVLVVGGAGYVGSHACKALALAGHDPICYDNLSTGFRALVKWGDFVHGDVLDTGFLAQLMIRQRIEAVMHFAALSCVGESVLDPAAYYHNNVVGTFSVLRAMGLAGVRRLVFSSTCAVYGNAGQEPIAAETVHAPVSPYGAGKSMVERFLADFQAAYGLQCVALRYFNAAGADPDGETGECHQPETHLIPRALMAAFGDIPPLSVFGGDYPTPDGTCVRDYIHVCDLARAHVQALFLPDTSGLRAFNLGTGRGWSVREVLAMVSDIVGKDVPVTEGSRRAGDPPMLVAQVPPKSLEFPWAPEQSDLAAMISSAASWYTALRQHGIR